MKNYILPSIIISMAILASTSGCGSKNDEASQSPTPSLNASSIPPTSSSSVSPAPSSSASSVPSPSASPTAATESSSPNNISPTPTPANIATPGEYKSSTTSLTFSYIPENWLITSDTAQSTYLLDQKDGGAIIAISNQPTNNNTIDDYTKGVQAQYKQQYPDGKVVVGSEQIDGKKVGTVTLTYSSSADEKDYYQKSYLMDTGNGNVVIFTVNSVSGKENIFSDIVKSIKF